VVGEVNTGIQYGNYIVVYWNTASTMSRGGLCKPDYIVSQ